MSEVSLKRFYFALFDDGLVYFENCEIGVYRFLNSNSSYIPQLKNYNFHSYKQQSWTQIQNM